MIDHESVNEALKVVMTSLAYFCSFIVQFYNKLQLFLTCKITL